MAEASVPVLEIAGLSVAFAMPGGEFQAVRGVDLLIEVNESVAIIGESGSGKSVTASAIMGLIDAPGQVGATALRFCGVDLLSTSARTRRSLYGRRLAMVFQDALAHLNPVYPVGWQVAEVCRIHGVPAEEARARALAMLERVGIPDPSQRYHDYPHQFSGGQRQRILIAMAVVMRPDLLIADEPTTALDVTVQAQILDLLRSLREETGMSLLMITHDLGVAADIADRVVVMNRGEFVETGRAQDVLAAPKHPYTRKLLAARPAPQAASDGTREAEPPVFEAQGLKLYHEARGVPFGRAASVIKAVEGVDFVLKSGEVLGVVGESGSGKSSVARMLLRLERPTDGQVLFRGRNLQGLTGGELKDYRRRVQAVFQDPYTSLNPRMTILRVLSEAWELHPGFLPRERWHDAAAELLEQVGLAAADLDKYPGQFSGGQRQRIAIARALALKPQVVICDEAVSALDMSVRAQVIDLLAKLRRQLGLAYFFIAHDLKLIEHFADRVVVMRQGRIVEQGPVRAVFDSPSHPYTRALIAASPVANPALQSEKRRRLAVT
jgi:peptide/nickel transport system ATP-binding protein